MTLARGVTPHMSVVHPAPAPNDPSGSQGELRRKSTFTGLQTLATIDLVCAPSASSRVAGMHALKERAQIAYVPGSKCPGVLP